MARLVLQGEYPGVFTGVDAQLFDKHAGGMQGERLEITPEALDPPAAAFSGTVDARCLLCLTSVHRLDRIGDLGRGITCHIVGVESPAEVERGTNEGSQLRLCEVVGSVRHAAGPIGMSHEVTLVNLRRE